MGSEMCIRDSAFSAQGLRAFTGVDTLADALMQVAKQTSGFVCVTDGENGVYSVVDGEVVQSPAYSITPVDTLGAGDVWHAAFVYNLANGNNESQAIRFSNAAAAIKCTRNGGGRESPTLAEVFEFMRERGDL